MCFVDRDEDDDDDEDDDLSGSDNMVRWTVDTAFKKDQEKMNIPQGAISISTISHLVVIVYQINIDITNYL